MSFSSWARDPDNRGTVIALGTAAAAIVALGWRSYAVAVASGEQQRKRMQARGVPSRERGEGYLLCPADLDALPGNTSGLSRGDFVIIQVSAKDDAFREPTWAQVLSISPDGSELYIKITGEYLESGVRPLSGVKHGYNINDRMIIPRTCVFDMLHIHSKLEGIIACGPELSSYTSDTGALLYEPVDASEVGTSDLVQIVVSDSVGGSWSEPLWVMISKVSPTKQVLTGIVTEPPTLSANHKLQQYSQVSFNRDCIIDIRHPFIPLSDDDTADVLDP